MDNVTHGLAGLLVADVAAELLTRQARSAGASPGEVPGEVPTPRLRRALSVLGIVAAEFPDSDLVYSGPVLDMGSLGYLLHHRGHTHTIVWAVVSAVVLWLTARWWVQRRGAMATRADSLALLGVALVGTLSHLLLDFTNSYGVHPFWPFDGRWYYGDAVFIVEPWLWLVAIPPLWWNRPRGIGRVLLPMLLVLILAAAFLLGQVARDVSLVLLVFAMLWSVGQRWLTPARRTVTGVAAWVLVTVGFFVASGRAEAGVRAAVMEGAPRTGERVHDVVLNPGPGDFGCWSAIVVTATDSSYRVSTAFVAPFASARPLSVCTSRYRTGRLGSDVLEGIAERGAPPFGARATVQWRSTWHTSLAALATIDTSCEGHAALLFMRVPVFRATDTMVELDDARFGIGGGFSNVTYTPGTCSLRRAWLPGWVAPRGQLLEGN